MEDKELQELERALQAASPAPWRAKKVDYYTTYHCSVVDANDFTVVTDEAGDGSDTAAIAALWNAAPALLSDLREARRLLGEARYEMGAPCSCECEELSTYRETRRKIDAFLGERTP